MPNNGRKTLGSHGEQLAVDYLRRRGYRICERNVRGKLGELDIVARDGSTLVFVEVRSRRGREFGTPAESITARKRQKLINLAEQYVQNCSEPCSSYRIDVVAVELSPSGTVGNIELIKNAVEG